MIVRFLRHAIDTVTTVMGVLAGLCLIYLIFGTTIDILMRRSLGWGYPAILEYAEVVMVAMIYFSLAQTQRLDGHVSVEMVTRMLPQRLAAAIEILGLLIVCAVLVLIADRALDIAWRSWAQGEYRLGMSKALIWPVRFIIVLGLAMLVAQLGLRMLDCLRVLTGRPPETPPADAAAAAVTRNL